MDDFKKIEEKFGFGTRINMLGEKIWFWDPEEHARRTNLILEPGGTFLWYLRLFRSLICSLSLSLYYEPSETPWKFGPLKESPILGGPDHIDSSGWQWLPSCINRAIFQWPCLRGSRGTEDHQGVRFPDAAPVPSILPPLHLRRPAGVTFRHNLWGSVFREVTNSRTNLRGVMGGRAFWTWRMTVHLWNPYDFCWQGSVMATPLAVHGVLPGIRNDGPRLHLCRKSRKKSTPAER